MPFHFIGFGLTFGAMLPIRAVVMAHWYSGPGYGRIMGAQWSFAAVAGAIMPALAGVIRDATGDYAPVLVTVAFLFLLAATAALLSDRRSKGPSPSTSRPSSPSTSGSRRVTGPGHWLSSR